MCALSSFNFLYLVGQISVLYVPVVFRVTSPSLCYYHAALTSKHSLHLGTPDRAFFHGGSWRRRRRRKRVGKGSLVFLLFLRG